MNLMTAQHPDAAALERIGRSAVMEHFSLSRQNWYHWRKRGLPRPYRKPVKLLGESLGLDMSDFCVE
jgi:hypothetical protein